MSYMRMQSVNGMLVPVAVAGPAPDIVVRDPVPVAAAAAPLGFERPSPAFEKATEGLHTKSVAEIAPLIRRITDTAELRRIADTERGHPLYTGGRAGVFKLIAARLVELGSTEPLSA